MDRQLAGLLIAAAVAIPYMVEIIRQVPLLTRMMATLPAEVRDRLPAHPRRPGLAFLGSTRFFLALFRHVVRDTPQDSAAVRSLKRQMRASAVREAVFGVVLAVVVTALWRSGWLRLTD